MGTENAPNSDRTDSELFSFFSETWDLYYTVSLQYWGLYEVFFLMVSYSYFRGSDVFVESKQP